VFYGFTVRLVGAPFFFARRKPVGAAAGCDLLMLFFKSGSKDRSLRQLLHSDSLLSDT
jgi:hypothetical protein